MILGKRILFALSTIFILSCRSDRLDQKLSSELKVLTCNCFKKPIQFAGFLARKHPEIAQELWCSASIKNSSKKVIEQLIVTVQMQTETGYMLNQDDLYSDRDYYKSGAVIKFKSSYGTRYDLRYRKALCFIKEINVKEDGGNP
ncbi:hypothetical protein EHO98_04950 [Leptospira stimsonii]|uniref:Lipoprotein n=1 Tax=Leptospira stimsonii TaxID=2202203 RepID=A0ABY2N4R2_9LEPT|nr:hypothetical protein EHO98_04950 [Leptospira stimsonii]TGM16925.1 hypothetical protein EHQ90_08485 [Leptospira stimsonii]